MPFAGLLSVNWRSGRILPSSGCSLYNSHNAQLRGLLLYREEQLRETEEALVQF